MALLDVLGFSALIQGDRDGRLTDYLGTLQTAFEGGSESRGLEYIVFSDSIIVTTGDDSETSLESLFKRCSFALHSMLEKEIPLRGAIAHGSFTRETTKNGGVFVAGKPIVEAYRFETVQNWLGIMVAPSVLKKIPDLAKRCELHPTPTWRNVRSLQNRMPWVAMVQRADIPFHQADSKYGGFAIVPTSGDFTMQRLVDDLDRTQSHLRWLKSLAPDPAAQSKYEAAWRWVRSIWRNWDPVARAYKELQHPCVGRGVIVRKNGVDRNAQVSRVVDATKVDANIIDGENIVEVVTEYVLAPTVAEELIDGHWWPQ